MNIPAALATCFLVFLLPSSAEEISPSFENLYASLRAAIRSKNSALLDRLLARDFVSEDVNGRQTRRAQFLDGTIKSASGQPSNSRTTIVSKQVHGSIADVVQRYESTSNRLASDGKSQLFEIATLSTDRWHLEEGVWRIEKTVTQKIDVKVDGVPSIHKEHAN